MEKTNELNKFLSYIHMGNGVYRIYYEEAVNLKDHELIDEIVKTEEIFKTHEESITRLINEYGEEATNSITAAGLMGIYKEKMKSFDDSFDICISAVKTTNMGMVSAIKFLKENKNLPKKVKNEIKKVITDYSEIIKSFTTYLTNNLI